MLEFTRTTTALNFIFEKNLEFNQTIILKIPDVSPKSRGINDIGWQSDGNITLYGTLSSDPESQTAIWQEIEEGTEVNKTISALKIINGSTACNVVVRVIFN